MELNGTVKSIIFRNATNGYTVLSLLSNDEKTVTTCVGTLPLLNPGDSVIMNGEPSYHARFGSQFKVASYERKAPSSETSIIKYLESGAVRGVGPSMARAIVSTFGLETLNVLENETERLTEVPGIGKKKAKMISDSFREKKLFRDVLISLEPYGVTVGQAYKMMQTYGELCLAKVQENPYQLIDDIDGIGFLTADKIATHVSGFEQDSLARLMAGTRYCLQQARDEHGDMFLPRDLLLQRASALLGASAEQIEETVDWMISGEDLLTAQVNDVEAVYLPYLLKIEDYTAKKLLLLNESPTRELWDLQKWQSRTGLELSQEQQKAVLLALNNGVSIITGGPGTGKTTIIRCINDAMQEKGLTAELAAPTGRAAKRMTEATGTEARTIHRLLEYIPGEGFQRNRDNPLLADAVIIDEMSMVDAPLMYALLQAISKGTRLILVGDRDQLPPVGCGNVFSDALASGCLPSCRLTEIFRQAQRSAIVRNAHLINQGRMPVLADRDSDFIFEEIPNIDRIRSRLTELVLKEKESLGTSDPLLDVQVLVPMKTTAIGVSELNRLLQSVLNPPSHLKTEHISGATVFREGDKIMQIRNNYKIEWRKNGSFGQFEEGVGVFNGDFGTIIRILPNEKTAVIGFDDGRVAEYAFAQLEEIDLAYCITIHKSQGSEFSTVILPLAGGPVPLLTRNLLYTAVTRAKKLVYCIGRKETVARMVQNAQRTERNTGLRQRLEEYADLR
ncbi:MAG: ATP-dependent RecD-like DNA helicase [Clostridia bacterium]|nr:ATP-dependent RecD-like DNA helicase [Clostridia bacterium]